MKSFISKAITHFIPNLFNAKTQSSYQIRQKWERWKNIVRITFACFFIILFIVGFEIGTPNYSFSGNLYHSFINNSQTAADIIDTSASLLDIKLPNSKKFKLIGIALSTLFIFLIFLLVDPFSNYKILRYFHKIKKYSLYHNLSPFRDLIQYAKCLPSNLLVQKCSSCEDSKTCSLKLSSRKEVNISAWGKIFYNLSPETINRHLKMLTAVRAFYYFKNTLLLMVPIQITVYFFIITFEYYNPSLNTSIHKELILYIFTIALAYIIVEAAERFGRSPLANYKMITNDLFNSQPFKNKFEEQICNNRNKNCLHLQNAITAQTNDFFNIIIDKQQKTFKEKANSTKNACNTSIKNLIETVHKAHKKEEYTIRASLLIPIKNDMRPWICHSLDCNKMFSEYKAKGNFFCIKDGNSIASKSWRRDTIISTNKNIPYYYNEQNKKINSIMSLPIKIQPELISLLTNSKIQIANNNIAILCLDSNSKEIFSLENKDYNIKIVSPYIPYFTYCIFSYILKC